MPRLWVGRRKEPILCYVPKNEFMYLRGKGAVSVGFNSYVTFIHLMVATQRGFMGTTAGDYILSIAGLRRRPKVLAKHNERIFEFISHFGTAQNLVARHYETDFGMILRFKVAQNLIANHYEQVLT